MSKLAWGRLLASVWWLAGCTTLQNPGPTAQVAASPESGIPATWVGTWAPWTAGPPSPGVRLHADGTYEWLEWGGMSRGLVAREQGVLTPVASGSVAESPPMTYRLAGSHAAVSLVLSSDGRTITVLNFRNTRPFTLEREPLPRRR